MSNFDKMKDKLKEDKLTVKQEIKNIKEVIEELLTIIQQRKF